MRGALLGLAMTVLMTSAVFAEDDPALQSDTTITSGSTNGAVNGKGNAPSTVNASGTATIVATSDLEQGSNSFTEAQTRTRLEGAGLTSVTDLHKDDRGIWRGKAMRNGKSVAVGFDYKGNIGVE